jgi:CBS-domain-containing membrane protein
MFPAVHDPLQRLHELTVADVMSRNVVVIPDSATMDQAASLLDQAAATGAPVVNEAGSCVGVLSTTDFLKFEMTRGNNDESSHIWLEAVNGDYLPWNSVQRFMSKPLLAVRPTTPLMEAAQVMCGQHIHRVLILDGRSTLLGIASTLDIVAAVIKIVGEFEQRSF